LEVKLIKEISTTLIGGKNGGRPLLRLPWGAENKQGHPRSRWWDNLFQEGEKRNMNVMKGFLVEKNIWCGAQRQGRGKKATPEGKSSEKRGKN